MSQLRMAVILMSLCGVLRPTSLPAGAQSTSPETGSRLYVARAPGNDVAVIDPGRKDPVVATVARGELPAFVAVIPDGKRIYVAAGVFFEETRGRARGTFLGDPSGEKLLVLDSASRQVVAQVKVPGIPIALAVSPDGRWIYVANGGVGFTLGGNTVSVIDTSIPQVVATVTVGETPRDVAVSPDGRSLYVANFDSDTVSVIDTASRQAVATVPVGASPSRLAVSPDGQRLYVANRAGRTVSVIDTVGRRVVATLPVGLFPVDLELSPRGQRLYVVNRDSNSVTVIDTTAAQVVATLPTGDEPSGAALSPDGQQLCVANRLGNSVTVIETGRPSGDRVQPGFGSRLRVVATVPVGRGSSGVTASPDGRRFYVANSESDTISVMDAVTHQVVATLLVGNGPTGVSVSLDSAQLYVSCFGRNGDDVEAGYSSLAIVEAAQDSAPLVAQVPVGEDPSSVAVSPDGKRVYVANYGPFAGGVFAEGDTVSILDASTGQLLGTVKVGKGALKVVVSPDSRKAFVASSTDRTLSVIDAATMQTVAMVPIETYENTDMTVSPDGQRLYVTSFNTVQVIDTASYQKISTRSLPEHGARAIAISPDGKRLYVTSEFHRNINDHAGLSVLDASTLQTLGTVPVGGNPTHVAVSPDGGRIYVANSGSLIPRHLSDALDLVSVIDAATLNVVATVRAGEGPSELVVSRDGRRVYVANFGGDTVSVIDAATNQVVADLTVGFVPASLALGP